MPKITVEFANEDEFDAFRTSGKRTRSSKNKDEAADTAPPTGADGSFVAPTLGIAGVGASAPGTGQSLPGFPPSAPAIDPRIGAIVSAVEARVAATPASAEPMVNWFRQQLGPNAAQMTWEQIKSIALPRLNSQELDIIAKSVGVG